MLAQTLPPRPLARPREERPTEFPFGVLLHWFKAGENQFLTGQAVRTDRRGGVVDVSAGGDPPPRAGQQALIHLELPGSDAPELTTRQWVRAFILVQRCVGPGEDAQRPWRLQYRFVSIPEIVAKVELYV